MPIKPKPAKYTCHKCGWSKIFSPASDAIMSWEHAENCPECGNKELDKTPVKTLKETINDFLGELLK